MGKDEKFDYGHMDFSRLWGLLDRRGLNKRWLRLNGLQAHTVSNLVKNQNVNTETLSRLCYLLNAQPWELMEYIKPSRDAIKSRQNTQK